jgi:putative transcriptional regulator
LNIKSRFHQEPALSGSILLSHPTLKDPNFFKSIVFLSAHSTEQGTLGVILNRPLCKSLAQLDKQFSKLSIGDAPVYEGGPVDKDKIILAAWEWSETAHSFKLYFGIDTDKAQILKSQKPEIEIACFLGHSGWSPGQLENELDSDSWLVSSFNHDLFEEIKLEQDTWKSLVSNFGDELRLLADAPQNPSVN